MTFKTKVNVENLPEGLRALVSQTVNTTSANFDKWFKRLEELNPSPLEDNKLLTRTTRESLISQMVEWLNGDCCSEDLLRYGHRGYDNYTDLELLEEVHHGDHCWYLDTLYPEKEDEMILDTYLVQDLTEQMRSYVENKINKQLLD